MALLKCYSIVLIIIRICVSSESPELAFSSDTSFSSLPELTLSSLLLGFHHWPRYRCTWMWVSALHIKVACHALMILQAHEAVMCIWLTLLFFLYSWMQSTRIPREKYRIFRISYLLSISGSIKKLELSNYWISTLFVYVVLTLLTTLLPRCIMSFSDNEVRN